ncbi:MAG: MMPL family transporter [Pseudomonadota bacterium]
MRRLAQLIANRNAALAIVAIVLLLVGGGVVLATNLAHEDNILAFLPAGDPDVKLFHQLNERFGGLQVALVGLEAEDAFSYDFMVQLKQATDDLKDTNGLEHVLSMVNIPDFTLDPERGGIVTGPLIREIPHTPKGKEALRRRVLSQDHVVGNFVSENSKAVLVYCFLAHGSDPKKVGARIKTVINKNFPNASKYWGGGPFISSYIYNVTQQDMRRLTPWAVLGMLLVMLFSFRDIVGTCLALLSTSFGVVFTYGLMVLFNEPVNLVLSSLPVILFAVGSAYGIHVLARYYQLVQNHDRTTAIVGTLTSTGPTVIAAGLTTVASMFSFMSMDLRPMRVFGLFTGLGVMFTLILSLTFIPAVIRLVGVRARKEKAESAGIRSLVRAVGWLQRRRGWVLSGLGCVVVGSVILIGQVDSRIETTSLFSKGSPPDLADQFLRRYFGGSQFLQIQVEGDMTDPRVLREVQWMADQLSFFPQVSGVTHIGEAMSRANEAMEGQRRVPDTADKVRQLYIFMSSEPSIRQLVSDDHKYSLIQVKAAGSSAIELEDLLQKVEGWFEKNALRNYRIVAAKDAGHVVAEDRLRNIAMTRIMAALRLAKKTPTPQQLEQMERALSDTTKESDHKNVIFALKKFLRSEESIVILPPAEGGEDLAQKIAVALAALGPDATMETKRLALARILSVLPNDSTVDDLILSLEIPAKEIWRKTVALQQAHRALTAANIVLPEGLRGQNLLAVVSGAFSDMKSKTVLLPVMSNENGDSQKTVSLGTGSLNIGVNGMPVINRSLSRSALANQFKSLGFALIPVILIMAFLFRSLRTGLLVSVPTLLTLLVVYGGMGLLGVHLDIGTAMLACIILGSGVDYGVHLVAEWHFPNNRGVLDAAIRAVRRTGGAIWINAVMVCTGFAVLTLGQARPLQNVGGLTAVAMITAAVATFVAVPVLARRAQYVRGLRFSETVETVGPVEDENRIVHPSSASGRDQ